jgi:hypothetical protein
MALLPVGVSWCGAWSILSVCNKQLFWLTTWRRGDRLYLKPRWSFYMRLRGWLRGVWLSGGTPETHYRDLLRYFHK